MTGSELAGKRVLVVGLGVSGFSAAKALIELEAKVRVTEAGDGETIRERADQLRAIGVEVETGGHDLERLDADLAVISPGIPPTAPIAAAIAREGLELWSEVELAYRLAECEFLAVTGTNGKTTTTSLLAKILQEAGVQTVAAGNIGYPLIDAIASVPADGAIALEVSSFQLVATERFKPRVAVLLNVAEDHTDWHGSFTAYRDAKARVIMNQTSDDVFLPNAADETAMSIATAAASRVVPFSATSLPVDGIGVRDEKIVWRGEPVLALEDLALPGLSGIEDTVAAAGAALEYGIDRQAVIRAVHSFQPLGHRLQVVANAGGITFIDDSKATNPHATLAALRGASDVVLIAGGRSKGIDLSPLREAAGSLIAVIAIGEAREEIREVFSGTVPVVLADTMDEAVRAAASRSIAGGSVLLSPGCASLDMYGSYAQRGEDFARAVGELLKRSGGDGMATRSGTLGTTAAPRTKARAATRSRRGEPATLLMVATGALVLLGLIMILSASSVSSFATYGSSFLFFNKQLLWAGVGLAGFVFFSRYDYRKLKGKGYILLPAVGVLLLAVLIPGVGIVAGGSARWIGAGPLAFQPSELAKFALILFLADVFSRKEEATLQDLSHTLLPFAPVLGALALLVMMQPDMGTTLLLGSIGLGMLFAAGAPLRYVLPMGALGATVAVGAALSADYRRERVLAFMDPWADPLNTGYHTIQSLIALGSGGWLGVGLGASRQKWSYIPNAHTDFIFAILGEEMGLLGTLTVLGLFAFIMYLGVRIARTSRDRFGMLVASGITIWIGVQALVNIGAVTATMPITGVPLPLVSFGGSSLVVSLMAMGVLTNIARQARKPRGAKRPATA